MKEKILELEGGRTRPQCVKNSHCKRPRDCHKTDCRIKELMATLILRIVWELVCKNSSKNENPRIIDAPPPQKKEMNVLYFIVFLFEESLWCEMLIFSFMALNVTQHCSNTCSVYRTILMLLFIEESEWCIVFFSFFLGVTPQVCKPTYSENCLC
jgi:hypothetical protein